VRGQLNQLQKLFSHPQLPATASFANPQPAVPADQIGAAVGPCVVSSRARLYAEDMAAAGKVLRGPQR